MFFYAQSKDRPFHWGTFPLESLARDDSITAAESARPQLGADDVQDVAASGSFADVARHYRDIYAPLAEGITAPERAPVPDDLDRRTMDIKGCAYFMDADQVGIADIPPNAWLIGTDNPRHDHGITILVEHPKIPDTENLAHEWVQGTAATVADMRAAEIATLVAGHIRAMGFDARAHIAGDSKIDLERMAVLSGIAIRTADGLDNPYLGKNFSIAVISTEYALSHERPLDAASLNAKGVRYWWGQNGARSGRERNRRRKRPSHFSRYPMETVKRIDRPTTLILDDEIPRVPKRAAFFQRALHGDLGEKTQRERQRFAFKTPLSASLLTLIKELVPHQTGTVADPERDKYLDLVENSKAIKALAYYLGADLVGICEVPRYAWYSHKEDGSEITPYHKYAVVMLIDQGFDTMEGASGDDWISGAQSMRGYLRSAEIAGIMAEFLRGKGMSSRPQTNADSDVLQLPLVLWAGLGELSRIGELVLNPFVGPRFKSVVMTTDMPLEVDRPIDFGLQYFCQNCLKCARECPCDAIPFGDKVMFNGYEIWKPDVERCARYRITNPKGSACGRCMKTCPINKVVDSDGPLFTRAASWMGVNALALKPLMVPIATWMDDWLGNGKRNPAKKWWFDHEVIDGVTVDAKATNERELDISRRVDPADQKMAYYHANQMPPPDEQATMTVNRKAAMAAGAVMETPDEARARIARGGERPAHYIPTEPTGVKSETQQAAASPYAKK